jgi:hypothetical protein
MSSQVHENKILITFIKDKTQKSYKEIHKI